MGEAALERRGDIPCMNCGSDRVAAFCADCGQRRHAGRFALRPLAASAADELLRFDRGLLRTAADLTMRPGPMLREYIGGRTRPFTNPLKYLLITLALVTITYSWSGLFADIPSGVVGADGPSPVQQRAFDVLMRYFNVVLAFGVPFMALGSRLLFRTSGHNLAEHLIVNLYAYSQICLLSVAILPVFLLQGGAELYMTIYSVLMLAYYVFALRDFFQAGWLDASVRGSVIMAIAYSAYIVLGVLSVIVLRFAGALQ